MSNKNAFSLAEALITLLIVCIITIVSVPVLTKKKRDNPTKVLWIPDSQIRTGIRPTGHKDIILGEETDVNQNGIVVVNKMYFKDRKGKVIGWIAEDGSTSFAQGNDYDFNAMSQKQQQLEQTLVVLTNMLQQELNKQDNSNKNSSRNRRSRRHNSTNHYDNNVNEEELNAQIQELLRALQSQQIQ